MSGEHTRTIAPVIHLRNIQLRRGPDPLLEDVSVSILRGEKVGLVGRNGCGKSSLLALLRGELAPDRGEFELPGKLSVASVAQELPHSQQPVIEHVIDGDAALRACELELAEAEQSDDGMRHANLLGEYDALGGYTARTRAAELLDGLGFDPAAIDRPIADFSGGMRMRANLARALMCRSDLLLLDEPTNHLDLDAVLWLQDWLQSYPGTLILVSHDRDFLDAIIGRVLHISAKRIDSYTGNFSEFETQRLSRLAQQQAENDRIKRETERVQSFIDRFRAQATKARQAQSRIKWLERLPALVTQHVDAAYDWEFKVPRKLPAPLVDLDQISAGYGDRTIISGVKLSIAPGARLGILGRNGAGKSTLMKAIAGELEPKTGVRTGAPDLETGFFAQLEVDQLDASSTAIVELTRRGGPEAAVWGEQQKRDHLGRFNFSGDRVFEPVASFSGGERARLSLAILVARRPNLLLLDEPTNHLDLEMRDSLLLALQEFEGAVVVVSHDRGLLSSVCDEFVLVGHGEVMPFDGDLSDYATWLSRRSRSASGSSDVEASTSTTRKEKKRQDAESRNAITPLRAELRKVERDLERFGKERLELEQRMADPKVYASSDAALAKLPEAHAELLGRIAALEERWLELSEQLSG
jgi:ATP-binding cassette subfamily F protein 3